MGVALEALTKITISSACIQAKNYLHLWTFHIFDENQIYTFSLGTMTIGNIAIVFFVLHWMIIFRLEQAVASVVYIFVDMSHRCEVQ